MSVIGEKAFYNCTGLTSIVISKSVSEIKEYAFGGCPELSRIVVEWGNVLYLPSDDGCNALIQRDAKGYILCLGCKNTIIPDTVTKIGVGAFYGCTGLTSIAIPDSVKEIEESAFEGCTALKTIFVPAKRADYYKKRLPEELHRLIVELPAEKSESMAEK